ncbi:response regulator transcription factor [Aquimarina sp. 2201CG5-10]|uniref:LytR/AlgR family response regulator transcription factor n=1 Tax=Aquimarina callyspongiae TaxID=3098150 RepID=UPI002AB55DBE|nr:response regulator transcription factor [Aquimarina sp. 2201CG5-10]MDY8136163.1 response regulator transcription factor [Aquimarina sp. 2201CG5-10]
MKINAVLLEDEATARDHLMKLIEQLDSQITVITSLSTVTDSIHWFQSNESPDLIFMDIHLSDGISFEILEEVEINAPIIYITAYDEYAIKAFKTTGIDYLLKPITKEDLNISLEKFFKTIAQKPVDFEIDNMNLIQLLRKHDRPSYRDRFLLKSGNSLVPVQTSDIAYFYRDELVFAKLKDDRSFPIDYSLHQLQTLLDPAKFIRLNRQLLVGVNSIQKLIPSKPGQLSVTLLPSYHTDILLSGERSRWLKFIMDGGEV